MGNAIRVGIVRVGLQINKLLLRRRHRKKAITILLLGLQKTGKTTISLRISGKNKPFVPDPKYIQTKGFNTTEIPYRRNVTINLHDLGGHESIRELWTHYLTDAHGFIFVVDTSCSEEELLICSRVFQDLLREGRVKRKPILMLLNKQDIENGLTEGEIIQRMDLLRLVNSARCLTRVETCCAIGDKKSVGGISEGFNWLVKFIIMQYEELSERVMGDIMEEKEAIKSRSNYVSNVSNVLSEASTVDFHKERLPPDGGNAEDVGEGVENPAFLPDENIPVIRKLPELKDRKAKLAFEPPEEIMMVTTKVMVHGKDSHNKKDDLSDVSGKEEEKMVKDPYPVPVSKSKPSGFSVLKRKNKTAPCNDDDFSQSEKTKKDNDKTIHSKTNENMNEELS